jgi:4-alpha-glucanotransferase
LFALKEDGRPAVVAGVPPDYFAKTGQLWGNPIYRWERMAKDGYAWWVERFRGALELFDHIRVDHFRGFEAYWEVPGDAKVATHGRWAPGPGAELFRKVEQRLGKMPIIAEDLGVITAEVEALRDELEFPGMRVLQFAFGDDPKSHDYLPHSYIHNCVCYTGTHDNDTTVGWFHSGEGEATTRSREAIEAEQAFTLKYLNSDGREIHWDLIRLALSSVAEMALFPMQDLLGLGSEARMNTPGTPSGNWTWRFRWEMLDPRIEQRLTDLTALFDRKPVEQLQPQTTQPQTTAAG